MILMHDIVAVHHVAPLHIAETEEHLGFAAVFQRNHVPARVEDAAIDLTCVLRDGRAVVR